MPAAQMAEYLDWHWNEASTASFLGNRSRAKYGVQLFSMALQPMPVALQRASAARGPGALSMDPENGDKLWIESDIGWTSPVGDNTLPRQLKSVAERALAYQKKRYEGVEPTNYVSGDLAFVP